MATTLTAGQQGVLHMYDKEIAHFKAQRDMAEKSGNYEDVSYYGSKVWELKQERQTTLETFMAQQTG